MTGHFKLIEDLRQRGYRLTPQREMILLAIHQSEGHASAEEIYEKVQTLNPCVDISTVYRTLELLKDLHLVSETDLGGGCLRYELISKGRHHHVVCRKCGKMMCVDHSLLVPLEATLLEEYGFKADIEHLAIFGLCKECCA